MTTNLFNWRPIDTAPAELGAVIVHLRIITYVGGWSRPIDITPEVSLLERVYVDPELPGSGYWSHYGNSIVPSDIEYWTTSDEYESGIPQASWGAAPDDYFGVGPVAFIRPTEPRHSYNPIRKIYNAEIAWNGNHGGSSSWSSVKRSDPNSFMPQGYLDGRNVNAMPFRWCTLAEFLPQKEFDKMAEHARNKMTHALSNIERWRQL